MVKDSLGLLEVAGLLGAITASDAMVKAANVRQGSNAPGHQV